MAQHRWFVRRDLDGFFGLFVDNLVQIMVIISLGAAVCGLKTEFILARVLPGVALSVIFGNLFYSWQARRLARREGREDVTALPYGINTPSVIAFLLFIMAPTYALHRATLGDEAAARLAWQAGMVACLGSGLIEFFGAFAAGFIRRITPRAALLGSLAGIAIGFISMTFALQVFERPLLALLPAGIILLQYFSGARLPLGVPAGLAALLVGTALAWGIKAFTLTTAFTMLSPMIQSELSFEVAVMPGVEAIKAAFHPALSPPILAVRELLAGLTRAEIIAGLGVIIPMGLFNVIGSLQNLESAEAEGDRFPTTSSLAVNGLGSILAACFGSCFPTTIYIGHAGWKRLGARTGYSALNGLVIAALCFSGLIGTFSVLVPQQSVIGILIWIAVIIGAQAFQAVPNRHAPAVVLGLFPALAAWGLLVFTQGILSAGKSLPELGLSGALPDVHLGGMIGLDRGFILSSMGWAALGVHLIDRHFKKAAGWACALGVLSFFGVIHAWDPQRIGDLFYMGIGAGWRYAVPYWLLAGILLAMARRTEAHQEIVP